MSEQPKLSVLQRILLTITREEDEEKLLEMMIPCTFPSVFRDAGREPLPLNF